MILYATSYIINGYQSISLAAETELGIRIFDFGIRERITNQKHRNSARKLDHFKTAVCVWYVGEM